MQNLKILLSSYGATILLGTIICTLLANLIAGPDRSLVFIQDLALLNLIMGTTISAPFLLISFLIYPCIKNIHFRLPKLVVYPVIALTVTLIPLLVLMYNVHLHADNTKTLSDSFAEFFFNNTLSLPVHALIYALIFALCVVYFEKLFLRLPQHDAA